MLPMLDGKIEDHKNLDKPIKTDHEKILGVMKSIIEKLQSNDDIFELKNDLIRLIKEHHDSERVIFYPLIDQSLSKEEKMHLVKKMNKLH